MEQNLGVVNVVDKVPSNPNSPRLSRTSKAFYKFGARRQKHETSTSEASDPLLVSYNKSYEGEAPPGESEDVFDVTQDDKKKKHKKRNFLRKVSKLGRAQSNPIDSKARSSDSDDKVQGYSNEGYNHATAWPYKSSESRAAARSMDDLSAIPETNTNNNNITERSPLRTTSPQKLWGFGKKKKAALQVDQPHVVIKSAPSTPEKHRKKHSSMPSFEVASQTKASPRPTAIVVESDLGVVPEHSVKRRLSDATKQERHRSLDQNEMNSLAAHLPTTIQANSNIVRTSSLTYGEKLAAHYRQQHSTASPLGSQPSFLSSSTMDSQDSLNDVSKQQTSCTHTHSHKNNNTDTHMHAHIAHIAHTCACTHTQHTHKQHTHTT